MVDIKQMYMDIIRDRMVEIEKLSNESLSIKRLMVVIEYMNEMIDDVNKFPGKAESTDGTVIKGERTTMKVSAFDLARLGYIDKALELGYLNDIYISISSLDKKLREEVENDVKVNKRYNTTSYVTTDTNYRKILDIINRAKEEYKE